MVNGESVQLAANKVTISADEEKWPGRWKEEMVEAV